jgi:hypothetical protein
MVDTLLVYYALSRGPELQIEIYKEALWLLTLSEALLFSQADVRSNRVAFERSIAHVTRSHPTSLLETIGTPTPHAGALETRFAAYGFLSSCETASFLTKGLL